MIEEIDILRFYTKQKKQKAKAKTPTNEDWGKVMFLNLSVILFTGGGCLPNPPG